MRKVSRRTFAKELLAASALPAVAQAGDPRDQRQAASGRLPDSIAGYTMTAEEKELASKFLSDHERNMVPVCEQPLPNHLPPCFSFASPSMKKSGEQK